MDVTVVVVVAGVVNVGIVVAGNVLSLCCIVFMVAFGFKSIKDPVGILHLSKAL